MSGDPTEIAALPGFEELIRRSVDRPGAEDLSDGRRYTAVTLMRDYPDVYKSVVRALFSTGSRSGLSAI